MNSRNYRTALIKDGDQPELLDYTIEMLEEELKTLRYDSRKLDSGIYRANIDNYITFKEEKMPIVEAIELATQIRAEVEYCKELAMVPKEEIHFSTPEKTFLQVAYFNPNDYRLRAIELEKDAHRLSNAINAKNYTVEINFDGSKYF